MNTFLLALAFTTNTMNKMLTSHLEYGDGGQVVHLVECACYIAQDSASSPWPPPSGGNLHKW